ncbi:MAG: efflux RND transporter periplasmic adaptor subunit [Pseudomonadota bacterium]
MSWLKQRAGGFAATVLLIWMALWFLDEQQPAATVKTPEKSVLPVTVVEAVPADAEITINTTGITQARWLAEITASVSGRVVEVANTAIPGNLVKKGEILVSLEDVFYRAELEAAQAKVSAAELDLAETLNRQYVANEGDNTKSAFGRLEPHVKTARDNRKAATAALASAKQQLADTQIKAPFDAVVIIDSIHPGQWVNSGDTLFHMAASDFLDIKVELSEQNWKRLNGAHQKTKDEPQREITVVSPGGQRWQASIRYLSPVMDAVTRQRSLMLQVANPFQRAEPLLAGQQVTVVFEADTREFVVAAPASALTDDGKVWSVVDNSLRLETVKILDEQPDTVLFRYQDRPDQKRLLVQFPLSSFLEGQSVATTF